MGASHCFLLPRGKTPTLLFSIDAIPISTSPEPRVSTRIVLSRVSVSKLFREKPRALRLEARATVTRIPETADSRVSEELRRETEESLQWRYVCSQVAAFASTSAGRAMCERGELPVGADREESERLLDQTAAAVLLPEPLDFSGVDDVSEIVRSAVAGELLTVRELCAVERSLRAAGRVFEQLNQVSGYSDRYSPLLCIFQDCDFLTELAQNIEFCVDCTLSIVLDRASKKLESIRMDRKVNMEKLDSLLKEVSIRVFQAGGIDSPLITKRRSRMCVGVKASHKSLLPGGIVLSSSSSGMTYFMEPRDAVDLNNMEVKLLSDEKAEEIAILGFLTSDIAGSEGEIKHLMNKIVELDLASARGAYSLWIHGMRPTFTRENENLSVDIEGIQHPVLLEPSLKRLKMVKSSETVEDSSEFPIGEPPVPLDIKIGHATKVVVISGPNTGGKTATMKTLGLASLMSKAGLFLPAKSTPSLPWFGQVLADIGDHQSLEHSLSTFSGHISRLRKIINVVSKESLVLVDEIGSGTDPSEGVALSTSILQYLCDRVGLAVVTTHYADLSRLKAVDSRFENAAMEFCTETLQPTYRILWGSTGSSNALSVAKSIGFDQKVLDHAQEWVEMLMPDKQKERQGLLYQSLLEERSRLEYQAKKAASVLSDVKKLYDEIHSEAEDLDRREVALKAKETQLIQQELKVVKSQMDSIVKNFENRLQNATPDQFNSIMREAEAAIASLVAAHTPTDDMFDGGTENQNSYVPQIGDKVYVKGLGGKLATVVEEPGEDGVTMVRYGKIKVRVKKNDMKLFQRTMKDMAVTTSRLIKGQEQKKYPRRPSMEVKENEEEASFGPAVRTSKNTVDLRGMRVEEASHHLQMAISGSRSRQVLFVVHGMGSGAVKASALNILRNHPRVAKFEEESPMNYGCTIAYIK
ncbi:Endonuclease MutS2 [Ananas comosus]|uniref:Endonuclease MutS2 n=1 Tax=Ananas comosus TaxID=4615 RepID=A0A199VEG9_ANACO|nr:Endonuclease MutS2 [Ananas comosus]